MRVTKKYMLKVVKEELSKVLKEGLSYGDYMRAVADLAEKRREKGSATYENYENLFSQMKRPKYSSQHFCWDERCADG